LLSKVPINLEFAVPGPKIETSEDKLADSIVNFDWSLATFEDSLHFCHIQCQMHELTGFKKLTFHNLFCDFWRISSISNLF